MVDTAALFQCLGKTFCLVGNDHQLLNVQIVGSMRSAVEDIHHWNGKNIGVASSKIAIERETIGNGGSFCTGKRYSKHRVGAEFSSLIVSKCCQNLIDFLLGRNIFPLESR